MLSPVFTTLLVVVAFLIMAWDASREERNPLLVLGAFALLFVAVLLRLFDGLGLLGGLSALFLDVGIGLVAGSVVFALRKAGALPFLVLGLLALVLAALLFVLAQSFGGKSDVDSATLLLELGPDDRIEEVATIVERFGGRYERAFPEVSLEMDEDLAQVYLIEAPMAEMGAFMEALREDAENVDFVELNGTVSLPAPVSAETPEEAGGEFAANDPLMSSQWALEAIDGDGAHRLLRDLTPRKKAVVAILDTGVDGEHEDLQGVFRKSPAAVDRNGHGTHCAGIAGAATNNGVGMASLNWEGRFVEVMGYPALTALGSGTFETIAQAILDAARDGADVISMSLGDYSPKAPKVVKDAIAFAQRRGAIVVASAGNNDRDAFDHMPSNIDGVISVAAVDVKLQKARFSNTNTSLTRPIAAPGVDIVSLVPGGKYAPKSGTSMAAPLVSGLLGVLRALDPGLTADEAYTLLRNTGTTLNISDQVGPLINAEAAIRAVTETP